MYGCQYKRDRKILLSLYHCYYYYYYYYYYYNYSGLPLSGKSQGKSKTFQGQGIVRKFLTSQGKYLILSKSVKSQGILFSGL